MTRMAVRRESVVLTLDDRFSTGMARAAAATALLNRELTSASRRLTTTEQNTGKLTTSLKSLSTEAGRAEGGLSDLAVRGVIQVGDSADRSGSQIDRLSGRLRILADAAAILGPALIPIAAVGVPALTGLASAGGAAALGVGTMVAAFQGVGDTLKAVNEAQLEPTTENLEAARLAMSRLGPEARDLVRQVQEMRPAFTSLRDAAAAGLFPGLVDSLDELDGVLPRVERVLFAIGDAAGGVTEEFAEGIAGPRGREFLEFIETEMPSALTDLARTAGNLAGGFAEMWMAFAPLNRDFSGWMLEASRSFDDWAQGLAQTEGFEEFVAYIRENGPRVADALGALGNALLQIVEAAAPLGGPVLQALEAVADVIATIADSKAGPAIMATVTALALLSRGMRAFSAVSKTTWATNIKGAETLAGRMSAARLGRGVAVLAGVGLAASGVADDFGLANAATGALMGSLAGPWGAAVGGAVGLMLDLSASSEGFKISSDDLLATLDEQTGAITRNTEAWVANELEKQGVLSAAQSLGLDLGDVTQAALGEADAIERVTAAIAAAKSELYDDRGVPIVGTEELLDFKDNMFLVEEGIGTTNGALGTAEDRFGRLSEATDSASESLDRGASAAEAFANGLTRLNNLLEGRANMRDYEAALDDFTKGLKENGRSFDTNTEKGRLNQANLDNIAGTLSRVVEGMKRSERQQVLSQARADIRKLRADGELSETQMNFLLRAVQRLDASRAKPDVEVDISDALRAIGQVRYELQRLDGDRAKTYVETVYTSSGNRFKDVPSGVPAGADGMTIPGPRLPYGDRTLVLAAPGEELITNRNGEADQFRADRAAGRIPAYANGGTVGLHERHAPSWSGGAASHINVGAPSVSVGGASVRVFIDGSEVRAIVDERISSKDTYRRATGPRTTTRGRPE